MIPLFKSSLGLANRSDTNVSSLTPFHAVSLCLSKFLPYCLLSCNGMLSAQDPSGSMGAGIHHEALSTVPPISLGSVIVLHDVSCQSS